MCNANDEGWTKDENVDKFSLDKSDNKGSQLLECIGNKKNHAANAFFKDEKQTKKKL